MYSCRLPKEPLDRKVGIAEEDATPKGWLRGSGLLTRVHHEPVLLLSTPRTSSNLVHE